MSDDERTRIAGTGPRAGAEGEATLVRPARAADATVVAARGGAADATVVDRRPPANDATVVRRTGDAPAPPEERRTGVEIGEVLGHTYQLEAFLARGGMGAVYRARHQILESDHAIKLILPELARDPEIIGLMKQEAKALRKVKNDAVVEYQGLFLDEFKRRYLVMEFVDGPSLASVLADRSLTPDEVRTLRDRLALGLAAAHDKGVFHRDLSPDNIILPEGRIENAKIIDFGIAKSTEPGDKSFLDEGFAGKFSYVSPEQAGLFGGKIDGRSDIYSLGLVLAAAAIGFGGKLDMGNSPESCQAARQKVPDLARLPPELRDELARLLQPNPDDRPAGMRDIVSPEALAAAGEGGTIVVSRPDYRRILLALAGVLVVGAALAGIHWTNPRLVGQFVADDPKVIEADIRKALADLRCTTLKVDVAQDPLFRNSVHVGGYAPTPDDVKRITVELAGMRNISAFDNAVQVVDWPFCEAYNIVHTLSGGPAAPDQAPIVQPVGRPELVFRDGEAIRLQVTSAAGFGGYLYVDLFDRDGNVIHMLPTPKRPDNKVGPREAVTLGAEKGKPHGNETLYEVAAPYGSNLVVATTSAEPLFKAPRPQLEQAGDYLGALRAAMAAQQGGAERPMSYYRYLETAAP